MPCAGLSLLHSSPLCEKRECGFEFYVVNLWTLESVGIMSWTNLTFGCCYLKKSLEDSFSPASLQVVW